MRICILSEYSGKHDEGMRNTAYNLEKRLSKNHQILHRCVLPASNLVSLGFWRDMTEFKPDIVHYIPGPSLKALVFLKLLKIRYPGIRTVVLASHPFFSRGGVRLIPLFKPDLVLTPYKVADPIFPGAGCATRFLPNGIDLDTFVPVSGSEKKRLRRKYALEGDRFIALHVGSVDRERNVLMLKRLQQVNDTQVIIVGSTSLPMESDVSADLTGGGCRVWHEYFPDIAEIYQLADCYVFPTVHWRKCMELPVSVLEAMACNLPVISTPYKALPQSFLAGGGLLFAETEAEFEEFFREIQAKMPLVRTREKVKPFAWDNVIAGLEDIYQGLLEGENGR